MVWVLPHILVTVCWVFPELERNMLLFMWRCFNCPFVNKKANFLLKVFWYLCWLPDLQEICAGLTITVAVDEHPPSGIRGART
jgi:hypothetical protein